MSLRNAILELLLDGPIHGYRIRRELDARFGEPFSSAQIYQGLRWLEAQQLVESVTTRRAPRGRREIRITARGHEQVRAWLDRPIRIERPQRSELLVKVCMLGRRNPALLVRQLEVALRECENSIRRRRSRSATLARRRGDVVSQLVDAWLTGQAHAELAWIAHCLERLADLPVAPDGDNRPTGAIEVDAPRTTRHECSVDVSH